MLEEIGKRHGWNNAYKLENNREQNLVIDVSLMLTIKVLSIVSLLHFLVESVAQVFGQAHV